MRIGDTDFGLQVGIGFVGKIVTAVVAFGGSIILARLLGPDRFGEYYLLIAISSFLERPVIGWIDACQKKYTEAKFPTSEAIGATLLGIGIPGAVVIVGAYVLSPIIESQIGDQNSWAFFVFLFISTISFSAATQMLMATGSFGSSSWFEAGRDTLRVILQIGLVSIGWGVTGMVSGWAIAHLLFVPAIFYIIDVAPAIPSRRSISNISSFAKSSVPLSLVGTALSKMDVLLLGAVVGSSAVGAYEVALKLTLPAMFVVGVSAGGLMGRVSDRRSRDEPVIIDIQRNLHYASVLAIPLFFGGLTFGRQVVITAYGLDFAQAGVFVAGLALYRLFKTQEAILSAAINGFDRPDLTLKVSFVVFSVNLSLGIVLLYVMGPIGVVVATVIGSFLGYCSYVYLLKELVPTIDILSRPFLEQIGCGTIMAAEILLLKRYLDIPGVEKAILIIAVAGVTYFASLFLLSRTFRETLKGIAKDAGVLAKWGR